MLHMGIGMLGSAIGERDGAAGRLGLKRITPIDKMQRHGISRPSLYSNAEKALFMDRSAIALK